MLVVTYAVMFHWSRLSTGHTKVRRDLMFQWLRTMLLYVMAGASHQGKSRESSIPAVVSLFIRCGKRT